MTIDIRTSRADDEVTDPTDTPRGMSPVVAIAWPTGRPIYQYTADEIAEGVDVYTRVMKARAADTAQRGDGDASQR
jgi:hypothetical protein